MKGENKIWLSLYFEQLPLESFVRESSTTPVVILEKGRVVLANQTASSLGICRDSNMDAAIALSEKVISFERDKTKELSVLAHLAQWAYQFTPSVSIKAPDSLLLDITGCLKLFNGLYNLKKLIQAKIDELGYTVVLRINKTPLAALYTAYTRAPDNTGDILPSLQKLPIDCLRVEGKIIDSLKRTGIHDLGALLKLPESGLTRRFGVSFTEHLQKLLGKKADPQKFISPKPEFSSEIIFLSDVTNLNSLIFPMKRLLSEFCDFLKSRQLYVDQFTWSLSHRSHPSRSFDVNLSRSDNDTSMFQALTALHLEKIDDVKEIDSLCLSASVFSPADFSSGSLFHDTRLHQQGYNHGDRQRTDKLINMFRARLGPECCFGLSLANDHRPEKAWKRVRLDQMNPGYQGNQSGPRPCYLLESPRRLKTAETLQLLKGPERIDFGWWDPAGKVARDYYIARHNNGALYWIFNCHNQGKWYLHGIFA